MTRPEKLGVVAFVLAGVGFAYWWFFMKKNSILVTALTTDQQSIAAQVAQLATVADYADHTPILLALASQESSLNPAAHNVLSNDYGLFQIHHDAGWSWLRYYGYKDADVDRLFDPSFNTTMAINIVRYFEGKGFTFPAQADIYNVGETQWALGKRNPAYQQSVANYAVQFGAVSDSLKTAAPKGSEWS